MAEDYEDPLAGYDLPAQDLDTSMSPEQYAWEMTFGPVVDPAMAAYGSFGRGEYGNAALYGGLAGLGLLGIMPAGKSARMMSEAFPAPGVTKHLQGLADAPQGVRDAYSRGALDAWAPQGSPDPAAQAIGIPSMTGGRGVGAYRGESNIAQRTDLLPNTAQDLSDVGAIKELLQVQNAAPSLVERAIPGTSPQGAIRTRKALSPDEILALANRGLDPVDNSARSTDILHWGDTGDIRKALGDTPADEVNMGSVYNFDNETALDLLGGLEGQGHYTRHWLGSMEPETLARIDQSPELRAAAARVADFDDASGFVPRADIQNMRRIFAREGTEGLAEGLRRGVPLPAAAGGAFTLRGPEDDPDA